MEKEKYEERLVIRGLWEIGNREICEYAIKEKGKGNEVTGA